MSATPPVSVIPVIWNANAGAKVRVPGTATTAESLQKMFADVGLEANIIASESEEQGQAEVRRLLAEHAPLIVAAGGDGTIGQVATELLGTDVALGVIPLGSVMNIPRMLGVPRDVNEAVQLLAHSPRTALIDVGETNGEIFFEAASVGLHAAVFNAAHHFDDGRWPSPFRAAWMALRYRPGHMAIQLDGSATIHTRALMTVIANGQYAGAGMTLAPDARLDDGQFDVRVFSHFSKGELFRHLASIMFGRRAYAPRVETYRAAEVRITSHSALPCRADSVDMGHTPLECRVRARVLRAVVGPDFSSGRVQVAPG